MFTCTTCGYKTDIGGLITCPTCGVHNSGALICAQCSECNTATCPLENEETKR